MGEEQLLSDFFNAAIECQVLHKDKSKGVMKLRLHNASSITFRLAHNGAIYEIEPFKSVNLTYKGATPKFTIENMWHIDYQHPNIVVEIDK